MAVSLTPGDTLPRRQHMGNCSTGNGEDTSKVSLQLPLGQSTVSHATVYPVCVRALHHCFLPCLLAATAV